MWKYPEGRDHEFTAFDHPALGGQWCKDHGFDTIGRLVAAHQGIWTTSRQMPGFENEQPRKFDEWCLHFADLMASRAYLACDFDEMGDVVLDPWATRKEDAPKRTIKD